MQASRTGHWMGLGLAALLVAAALGGTSESKFHEAFYLEHAQGDLAAAAELYREVAKSGGAPEGLREEARSRADGVDEELSSADFARLMPANALAYVEINRPGDQLLRLIEQFGLLKTDEKIGGKDGRQIAISPALIRSFLDIRGAAAAVTGFDPAEGKPTGVIIVHPGALEALRGVIETALPAGGDPVEAIKGFPTYSVQGQIYVTLTRRLVIASQQRGEIENVVARMKGDGDESLADNPQLAAALKDRDDALLFFCVNFRPVLPLLKMAMAAGSTQSRELAMLQAVVDLDSLRTVVGRAGVGEDGLFLNVGLELDEGHHNLAFNFLRMPALDEQVLRRVPAGAAGFFAASLNESSSRFSSNADRKDGPLPPVAFMDIGRELFGNIGSLAVFALPTSETKVDGEAIPDLAAVLTVHDADKSRALWTQLLGLASMATAGGALDGTRVEIDGVAAQRFDFPDGLAVYFASTANEVILSPSRSAITQSLKTINGGASVLDDEAFAPSLKSLSKDSTLAAFVHAGRCLEIAAPHISADERQEIAPFAEHMTRTVASLVLEHSGSRLQLSTRMTGIPRIGPLITRLARGEPAAPRYAEPKPARVKLEAPRDDTQADTPALLLSGSPEAPAAESPEPAEEVHGALAVEPAPASSTPSLEADAVVETDLSVAPAHVAAAPLASTERETPPEAGGLSSTEAERAEALWNEFRKHAVEQEDARRAREVAAALYEQIDKQPRELNNYAWRMLTHEEFAGGYDDVAERFAARSNQLTGLRHWNYLDTLALARFKAGDVLRAISLEKRALELVGQDARRSGLERALRRFEAALHGGAGAEAEEAVAASGP